MRDLVIAAFLLGSVPLIFYRPAVGIIMWCVVSYMNPHRLGWGMVADFPFAMIIAVATLVAWLLSRERKSMTGDPIVVLMALMVIWVSWTTLFAEIPKWADEKWTQVIKMMVMTFLTIPLMFSRERIHALVWTLVVCIGIYGIKGGLFTLATGGGGRVFGPPNTMISDNNHLAVGLIMILPLMRYLQMHSANKWVRHGLMAAMLLTGVSIIGSFSRGAFVGGIAMLFWLFLRSRHKALIGVLGLVALVTSMVAMPSTWADRMETLQNYEEDASASGRLDAWTFALRMAVDRPFTGGGFKVNRAYKLFMQKVPDAAKPRAFHSIWFEMLGEHGFIGLGLFLILGIVGMRKCRKVMRRTRGDPAQSWAYDLAAMLQVSLVGYAVGGTFLNLAFFDFYYHLLVLVLLTDHMTRTAPADTRWRPPQTTDRRAEVRELEGAGS